MKLTANDTLLISSVKSDNILSGEEFEVSDEEGARLIAAGYATKVKVKAKAKAKAAPTPANKMAKAPANKSAAKRKAR